MPPRGTAAADLVPHVQHAAHGVLDVQPILLLQDVLQYSGTGAASGTDRQTSGLLNHMLVALPCAGKPPHALVLPCLLSIHTHSAQPYLHILHQHILGLEPLRVCNEHGQLAVAAAGAGANKKTTGWRAAQQAAGIQLHDQPASSQPSMAGRTKVSMAAGAPGTGRQPHRGSCRMSSVMAWRLLPLMPCGRAAEAAVRQGREPGRTAAAKVVQAGQGRGSRWSSCSPGLFDSKGEEREQEGRVAVAPGRAGLHR